MSSILEQEIYSQPDVIAHLLEREAQHIQQIVEQLPPFEYVLIAARGSSDHAATYAKYAWAALAGYPVALATPSLQTLYKTSPRMTGAFIVGISQSGQSPDIIAVLAEEILVTGGGIHGIAEVGGAGADVELVAAAEVPA